MPTGSDGCRRGLFTVILGEGGQYELGLYPNLTELIGYCGDSMPVYMDNPIGLREEGIERLCDLGARRLLAVRRSSVFPVPCRPAVYAPNYEAACDINEQLTGRRLSKQTWAISPRIREVDEFLANNEEFRGNIREIHPELCFYGLAGGHPMNYSKKTREGLIERREVLNRVFPETDHVIEEALANPVFRGSVGVDDVLDALAAAVTGLEVGHLHSIPVIPEFDAHNLPMEMVFRMVH